MYAKKASLRYHRAALGFSSGAWEVVYYESYRFSTDGPYHHTDGEYKSERAYYFRHRKEATKFVRDRCMVIVRRERLR